MDRQKLTEDVLRYLDGDLTESEERSLAEAIRGDPEAEKLLAELTRLNGMIPEALSEKTNERVAIREEERRSPGAAGAARRRRRARTAWGAWIAAAASAAAVAYFFFAPGPAPEPAPIAEAEPPPAKPLAPRTVRLDVRTGTGAVLREDGTREAVGRGEVRVSTEDRLAAGRRGPLVLAMSDGTRVHLMETGAAGFSDDGRRRTVSLEEGEVYCEVYCEAEEQPEGAEFAVATAHARAVAVGTTFRVSAEGEKTVLTVDEGQVRLTEAGGGTSVDVGAGSYAVAGAGIELAVLPVGAGAGAKLPLPGVRIPAMPPLAPTVITGGGKRLLLSDTDVEVRCDVRRGRLEVSRRGWWVVNYPFERIRGLEGKSVDEISGMLFGRPASQVRNWYVFTPGRAGREPKAPTGPAPIELTPDPDIIVDNSTPAADDGNPGTAKAPVRTITRAVAMATDGTVIRVRPGVYRETVRITRSGTEARPIRLEGVRAADGSMPVITGNDLFPRDAWKPVRGLKGVYRADIFTGWLGTCSAGGRTLVERSVPQELKGGQFCLNRASAEFLNFRVDPTAGPKEGDSEHGKSWRRAEADKEGLVDLRSFYPGGTAHAVIWGSTYVWIPPKKGERKTVWDPRFPEPVTGRVDVGGPFRAARQTGSELRHQVNKYRVWVDGKLLPSVVHYTPEDSSEYKLPRPQRNWGGTDQWEKFTLKEGWNHLVFQWDTTTRPGEGKFRFGMPKGMDSAVTSANPPPDISRPTDGESRSFVSEYLLLGLFLAEAEPSVFVRLPGDANPNTVQMDLAARGSALVEVKADFVQVRGFEIRHGAQFQQRAQSHFEGEGILLEGCLVRDSEVKGVSLTYQKDQTARPMVVRNNWILDPGNTGIGGSGDSSKLTASNQTYPTPGRSPVLIEHNRIFNNNCAGYPAFWESGGMKLFRLTGAVVRYNTIVQGTGPGIWFDWEHFNNRVEGNLFLNGWSFGVGIEASPGPNLIANNLCIDQRAGEVWFRHAYQEWSSDRVWVVNNTVDGRWNKTPTWFNRTGADGMFFGEGGNDRNTRWGSLDNRSHACLNNVVVGCDVACKKTRRIVTFVDEANFTDKGKNVQTSGELPGAFASPRTEDYRLRESSSLNRKGVTNDFTKYVTHDFHGLLRFPEDGWSVGAFRPAVKFNGGGTVLEVEFEDGAIKRLPARLKVSSLAGPSPGRRGPRRSGPKARKAEASAAARADGGRPTAEAREAERLFKKAETLFVEGSTAEAGELFRKIADEHRGTDVGRRAEQYLDMMQ